MYITGLILVEVEVGAIAPLKGDTRIILHRKSIKKTLTKTITMLEISITLVNDTEVLLYQEVLVVLIADLLKCVMLNPTRSIIENDTISQDLRERHHHISQMQRSQSTGHVQNRLFLDNVIITSPRSIMAIVVVALGIGTGDRD